MSKERIDFEKEAEYEAWCIEHPPWIFDRVVWTHVFGSIPPREYETTWIDSKIQLSYLSKFIRWFRHLFMSEESIWLEQCRKFQGKTKGKNKKKVA